MNSKIGASANDTPKFVARYIENFIDLVENVPNDLSRRITRVHELQLDYESSLSKLESNLTRFSRPPTTTTTTTTPNTSTQQQSSSNSNNHRNNKDVKQLKLLLATQHCLIKMQEISDNKLAIIQDALDQLDGKSRELDHDFKLINAVTSDGLETNNSNSTNSYGGTSNSNGGNNSACNNANSNTTTGTGNNSKGSKNNINNKHQSSSSSTSHHHPKTSLRESPEPTYCVCHQVSYGDMICCDNDACDIEWFHFQCVSLTSKPKGKWYCPNCRGDRSNQPKK